MCEPEASTGNENTQVTASASFSQVVFKDGSVQSNPFLFQDLHMKYLSNGVRKWRLPSLVFSLSGVYMQKSQMCFYIIS